jgi:hypothetical protein
LKGELIIIIIIIIALPSRGFGFRFRIGTEMISDDRRGTAEGNGEELAELDNG